MADLCVFVPGRDAFHSVLPTKERGGDGRTKEPHEDRGRESADQRTARLAAERAQPRRSSPAPSPSSRQRGSNEHSEMESERKSDKQAFPCGDAEVEATLKQRDPHGIGLPSAAGRDLLRRLLAVCGGFRYTERKPPQTAPICPPWRQSARHGGANARRWRQSAFGGWRQSRRATVECVVRGGGVEGGSTSSDGVHLVHHRSPPCDDLLPRIGLRSATADTGATSSATTVGGKRLEAVHEPAHQPHITLLHSWNRPR